MPQSPLSPGQVAALVGPAAIPHLPSSTKMPNGAVLNVIDKADGNKVYMLTGTDEELDTIYDHRGTLDEFRRL